MEGEAFKAEAMFHWYLICDQAPSLSNIEEAWNIKFLLAFQLTYIAVPFAPLLGEVAEFMTLRTSRATQREGGQLLRP
jgi:hypothetical protein